jgi:catalase
MTVNDNGGSSVNYEPNSFNGPKEKPDAKEAPFEVKGVVGRYAYNHPNDDFVQAGTLYRVVMNEQERTRLINNIVNHLKLVTREDIKIRSIRYIITNSFSLHSFYSHSYTSLTHVLNVSLFV